MPKAYHDELPPAPPYIPQADDVMDDFEPDSDISTTSDDAGSNNEHIFRTEPDTFGVVREYAHGKPSITPDQFHSLSEVSNSPYLALDPSLDHPHLSPSSFFAKALEKIRTSMTDAAVNFFAPFQNVSIFRLMTWFYRSSNTKSIGELNSLVKDVLLAPDFQTEDLVGFDAAKENARVDNHHESGPSGDLPSPFSFDDSWIRSTVEIPTPCEGFQHASEADAPKFTVEIHHRKITEVIKSAYSEPAAQKFHTFPFKAYWKPSETQPEERIYSESFTADAWNDEFEEMLNTAPDPSNSHLERFIIALMIWSDSTSLAQFGNAELWPTYLFIGGQSKYDRVKPSSFAAHHIAYMPKVIIRLIL